MKENEVPQDDANMFEGKTREIQYAINKDGHYTQVKSVGWEPKNMILQQAWEEVNECTNEALELVKNGTKSPIYYFMHKNIMDLKILSEYTGFFRWAIKKHFKPEVFNRLSEAKLQKYVEAFRLHDINDLKQFDATKY